MHHPYLDQLIALSDPERAEGMARYHKQTRRCLGLSNPQVNDLARDWRRA